MPPNTVKVARPGRWGNPAKIGEVTECGQSVRSNEDAVREFRVYLDQNQHLVIAARKELVGKNLACFCALDVACHADVLLEIANESVNKPWLEME